MSYSVLILRGAERELARLPQGANEKVKSAVEALADTPRPRGCRKLTGREGWRIRVGAYRVLYEVEDAA